MVCIRETLACSTPGTSATRSWVIGSKDRVVGVRVVSSFSAIFRHNRVACHKVGGQCETESCAARGIVRGPQAAAMRLDDRPADAQPHARAVSLGGKERTKNLVRLLMWKPLASIADRNH